MATRVKELLLQARATFAKGRSRSEPGFAEDLGSLKKLVNTMTSEDFSLSTSVVDQRWDYLPYVSDSPSACMEVYECPEFSLGIFLLKPNKAIPLHDHPGMYGIMKVLFGAMTVTSYSKSSKENGGEKFAVQKSAEKMFTPKSEPCCLFPEEGNIHEIRAHGGPVAFLDILGPSYNPKQGRDCTYYYKEERQNDSSPNGSVFLRPGSNPPWFSCIPLPYTGPKATD